VPLVANWVDGVTWRPASVVLLENCRLNKGEKKNDEALARKMARCATSSCTTPSAPRTAPRPAPTASRSTPIACAGPLLAAEIDAITKALAQPKRPLVAIVAGSKVSTKLTILQSLAEKVDGLIVGGGIANTFMLAGPADRQEPGRARPGGRSPAVIELMKARGAAVPIPTDVVVAKEFAADAPSPPSRRADVQPDDLILDIGPKTAAVLAAQLARPAPSCGTARWACSSSRQFSQRHRRPSRGHRRQQRLQHCRRRRHAGGHRQVRHREGRGLHLHRRRRLPGSAGRQDAAGLRDPGQASAAGWPEPGRCIGPRYRPVPTNEPDAG
jgi:hypothetical protein